MKPEEKGEPKIGDLIAGLEDAHDVASQECLFSFSLSMILDFEKEIFGFSRALGKLIEKILQNSDKSL